MIAALTGSGPRYRRERRLEEARRAKNHWPAYHNNPGNQNYSGNLNYSGNQNKSRSGQHNYQIFMDFITSAQEMAVAKGNSTANIGATEAEIQEKVSLEVAPYQRLDHPNDQIESQNPPADSNSSPSSHMTTPTTIRASTNLQMSGALVTSPPKKAADVECGEVADDGTRLRFYGPENKPRKHEDDLPKPGGADDGETPRTISSPSLFSSCGRPCLACFFPKIGNKNECPENGSPKPTVSADFWQKEKEKVAVKESNNIKQREEKQSNSEHKTLNVADVTTQEPSAESSRLTDVHAGPALSSPVQIVKRHLETISRCR
eukprot:754402-Hanusia_phi.AAC.3